MSFQPVNHHSLLSNGGQQILETYEIGKARTGGGSAVSPPCADPVHPFWERRNKLAFQGDALERD